MRIMEDSIPIEDAQHVSVRGEDEQDLAAPDDATDGMGALVFTDEEDYGFFGTLFSIDVLSLGLTPIQDHPQTSPSSVTFQVQ